MSEPIYEAGPTPAPVTYEAAGTGPIVPLACYAEFDGSGAAVSWKPALIFRSQAGHTFMQAATDETIAAGASAAVSWFPGVKPAAAAAAASDISWCYLHRRTAQSIANDDATHFVNIELTSVPAVNNGLFATNDISSFLHDKITSGGTDYYGIKIIKEGTYLVGVDGFWSGITAGAHGWIGYQAFPTGATSTAQSVWYPGRKADTGVDGWDWSQQDHIGFWNTLTVQGATPTLDGSVPNVPGTPNSTNNTLPVTLIATARHNSTGNRNVFPSLFVIRLGAGVYYFTSWGV